MTLSHQIHLISKPLYLSFFSSPLSKEIDFSLCRSQAYFDFLLSTMRFWLVANRHFIITNSMILCVIICCISPLFVLSSVFFSIFVPFAAYKQNKIVKLYCNSLVYLFLSCPFRKCKLWANSILWRHYTEKIALHFW